MDNADVISINSSSVITLSSTSDSAVVMKYMYQKKDNNATIKMEKTSEKASSSSIERVPVSWCSGKHNIHSITTNGTKSQSPSPKTKVTSWLSKKSNWSQVSVVSAPPRFVSECRKKSAILARHDFKKAYSISGEKADEMVMFSPCMPTSLSDSAEVFQRHNVYHIKTNSSELSNSKQGMFEIENAVPTTNKTPVNFIKNSSASRDYNIFVKKSTNGNEESSTNLGFSNVQQENQAVAKGYRNSMTTDTPLSPESIKKKELCTYLQLVNLKNATNHKKVAPNQNRRSVRVKNNLLLTEKKEMERKLNGENCEPSEDASKKSFKELFGENNDLIETNVENEVENKTDDLIIGCIPKELLERTEDFDECAREFFNRENMEIPQRETPKRNKKRKFKRIFLGKWVAQKPNDTLKKRKLREQFNRIFKNPVRKNGVYKPRKKKLKSGQKIAKKNKSAKENNERKKKKTMTKKKFLLRNNRVKTINTEENEVVNVVMQDHDYIMCNNEMEKAVKNSDADSSILPFYGFDSTELNPLPCEEINRLCSELSDYLQSKQQQQQQLMMKNVEDVPIENSNPTASIDVTITNQSYAKNDISDAVCITTTPQPREFIALDPAIKPKSLHRTLVTQKTRRRRFCNNTDEVDESTNWDAKARKCSERWDSDESPSTSKQNRIDKRNTLAHLICTPKEAGAVVKAFYRNFNLIVAQEFEVTFWSQSALGNILGANNMWLPKGQVGRLVLDSGCIQKESNEMVISLESSIAYVELWTKEHKSDKREIPVADVFAALYFSKFRQNGVFKKVLQLENIKSSADDVRYIVMHNSRNIIVSWRMVCGDEKTTIIRCYHLAADYQTVEVIKEIESVRHYVSSLHNIEGSDDLIVGWGENMITLWNLEYGCIIATVEIIETMPLSSPLYVKCDRGFLFLLQQLENGNICLIAINGLNQSWKRLQTFVPPQNFKSITGVYLEGGILVAFYKNGVLAWHVNSGELRVEEECLNYDICIPSGKHAIMFSGDRVYVRHALTLLIASDDIEGRS